MACEIVPAEDTKGLAAKLPAIEPDTIDGDGEAFRLPWLTLEKTLVDELFRKKHTSSPVRRINTLSHKLNDAHHSDRRRHRISSDGSNSQEYFSV